MVGRPGSLCELQPEGIRGMGLYPQHTTEPRDTSYAREWTETRDCYGYKLQRKITATEWVEVERTDCYCCSCRDNGYGGTVNDPYCRNHGWYGERPCEKHSMPGTPGEDGVIPDGVDTIWRRHGRPSN